MFCLENTILTFSLLNLFNICLESRTKLSYTSLTIQVRSQETVIGTDQSHPNYVNSYYKFFMSLCSNAARDSNTFRVKFSANPDIKDEKKAKDLILGSRARSSKEMTVRTMHQIEVEKEEATGESLENDNDLSKRQLQDQPVPLTKSASSNANESSIISNFEVVSSFFEYQVNFKLLYRASNHNFCTKTFHQLCDAYQDTLVICLTQDNKIIGGFTPLSWEDQFRKSSTHFKTDFRRETFLFSVSDQAKYPLTKSLKNKAICCFNCYGPTFGGGYDLLIGDHCNEVPSAYSYFPRNFVHPSPATFNKRGFTGTSRKEFKLVEWEVFHVSKLYSLRTIENINFSHPEDRGEDQRKSLWVKAKDVVKNIIRAICND